MKAFNISDGKEFELNISVNEQQDGMVTITTELNGEKVEVSDEYHFFALQKMRRILIKKGIDLKCYGALENAHPSPMMMEASSKVYLLTLGEKARMKDVFDMYDYYDVKQSISVDKQNEFYNKWSKSLQPT